MADFFFYGTLCHVPLLEAVLETAPGAVSERVHPARLRDHRVSWVADQPYPMIEKCPGSVADGLLLKAVTEDEERRLSYYEGAFSYALNEVAVDTEAGVAKAVCFYPERQDQPRGAPWALEDWVARWGGMAVGAARDVMLRRDSWDAETAAALRPFMMARHWARQMARVGGPATLRHAPAAQDVTIEDRHDGYRGFFSNWRISLSIINGSTGRAVHP